MNSSLSMPIAKGLESAHVALLNDKEGSRVRKSNTSMEKPSQERLCGNSADPK
jgi:hypothetical protein